MKKEKNWAKEMFTLRVFVDFFNVNFFLFTQEPPKFGRPGGGGGGGGGGMGSVKDRMAFFRKAAEDEKKAKEKQLVAKSPTAPVNRFTAPSPTSPSAPSQTTTTPATTPTSLTEKVSLKKAPDPNKAYVGTFDYFTIEEGDGNV